MYKIEWSLLVIITTIVISLIVLYIDVDLVCGLIYSNDVILYSLLLILINAILLFVIINIPLTIRLGDECIVVQKILGKIQIRYSDILFVKTFNSAGDLRIFGSGGFCGFIGKFSNNDYGWYSSYVLNGRQSFLISLSNNNKYAFSCENISEVVNKINMYIK